MNKLKYAALSFVMLLPALLVTAQSGGIKKAEAPAGLMQSDGKIYVVVAVILVILFGLFLYLYNLDKKITALENSSRK